MKKKLSLAALFAVFSAVAAFSITESEARPRLEREQADAQSYKDVVAKNQAEIDFINNNTEYNEILSRLSTVKQQINAKQRRFTTSRSRVEKMEIQDQITPLVSQRDDILKELSSFIDKMK
jgi:hypothetical protein